MSADQLANLRALAEQRAAYGGLTSVHGRCFDADVVVELLDALEKAQAGRHGADCSTAYADGKLDGSTIGAQSALHEHGLRVKAEADRDRLAARVLELEAPGECQSLHKLRAEVQVQSDRAEQTEILAHRHRLSMEHCERSHDVHRSVLREVAAERDEAREHNARHAVAWAEAVPAWDAIAKERDELAAEVRRLHEEARRGRLIMGDLCDMGSIKAVDWCSDGHAAEAAARSRGWL